MDWNDVLADPALRDLPYKVETNGYGQIVMRPLSNLQSRRKAEVAFLLHALRERGKVLMGCSVSTFKGVKVVDAAWASEAFLEARGYETPYEQAPEICVEISTDNEQEMQERTMLYLARGAQKVWLCSEDGALRFFGHEGEREAPHLIPDAPRSL